MRKTMACGDFVVRCAHFATRLLCGAVIFATTSFAQSGDAGRLQTNEAYVDAVTRAPALDMADARAVFAFVLRALPARVRVFPTENYYYFRFVEGGVAWAGSIRLGPNERNAAKVEFGYYKDLTEWQDMLASDKRVVLGVAEGVTVEADGPLSYRISLGDTSVVFALNDLSAVKPPAAVLAPGEVFLGPIFDESAVRFFLLYNPKAKVFHYVLDETVAATDELSVVPGSDRILLGRRTGFAFYRDHMRERKILIGVYEGNSRLNTYFDGPFDQLPENFIEGEALREAIISTDPSAKGEIDRLGNYLKEEGRFLIHPYMLYKKPADLLRVNACASRNLKRPDLYAQCFVIEPDVTALGPPPGKR